MLVAVDINIASVSFSETTWLVDGTANVTYDITHDLDLGGISVGDLAVKIIFSSDSVPGSTDLDSGLYLIAITLKPCLNQTSNFWENSNLLPLRQFPCL